MVGVVGSSPIAPTTAKKGTKNVFPNYIARQLTGPDEFAFRKVRLDRTFFLLE
jgi:hypothetical protein